jgi:hypothetical protein
VKTYRVPVDLFVEAPSQTMMENNVKLMMNLFHRDIGFPFGLVDYEFPVGLPEEPDESTSS